MNQFPKAMSTKKADAWIAAHPEVNAVAFWLDQANKHLEKAGKWMIVSAASAGAAMVVAAVGAILRSLA